MSNRIQQGGLQVESSLFTLLNEDILPGTGIDSATFWQNFENTLSDLAPKNKALLAKRDAIQLEMDQWYKANPGPIKDMAAYKAFLSDIGYLVPEGDAFSINTNNVDAEIATIAGPQLVVPVNNARFALNAANARWGSMFDALYGTDAIPEVDGAEKTASYNSVRGDQVVAKAQAFLDQAVPLASGSHADVAAYSLSDDASKALVVSLKSGETTALKAPEQLVGHDGSDKLSKLLLVNNGLHIEIVIDADSLVGKSNAAGIKDVVLESAMSTIMDCEDSVAAVDAEVKKISAKLGNPGFIAKAPQAVVDENRRRLAEEENKKTALEAALQRLA